MILIASNVDPPNPKKKERVCSNVITHRGKDRAHGLLTIYQLVTKTTFIAQVLSPSTLLILTLAAHSFSLARHSQFRVCTFYLSV